MSAIAERTCVLPSAKPRQGMPWPRPASRLGGDGAARPVNREPTAWHELRLKSSASGRVEDAKQVFMV